MHATKAQLAYIEAICEQVGLDEDEVLDEYAPGCQSLEALTVAQASHIIAEIKPLLR